MSSPKLKSPSAEHCELEPADLVQTTRPTAAHDALPGIDSSISDSVSSWVEVRIPTISEPDSDAQNYEEECPATQPAFPDDEPNTDANRNLVIVFSHPCISKAQRQDKFVWPEEPEFPPFDAPPSGRWLIKEDDEICQFYEYGSLEYKTSGGYAVIYGMRTKRSKEWVIVKRICYPQGPTTPDRGENWWRDHAEILVLQDLTNRHFPGVCKTLDVYGNAHTVDIVLEQVTGTDLYATLGQDLGEDACRHIAHQICSTMAQLHKLQVVHRDLSPRNIMMARDSNSKPIVTLIDFGAARLHAPEEMQSFYGTPITMAPEMGHFERSYGREVDVFSAGMSILYLLASPYNKIRETIDKAAKQQFKEGTLTEVFNLLRQKKASPLGLNFVQSLVEYEPTKRPSFEKALDHEWFAALSASKSSDTGRTTSACMDSHGGSAKIPERAELRVQRDDKENDASPPRSQTSKRAYNDEEEPGNISSKKARLDAS